MIYVMQHTGGGPLKIGFTDNLSRRHAQLEAHYKCPLAVLTTMDGDREEEAEIHARFAHLRLGRTEQFRPSADIMAFIGRPLLVGADPDAVEVMVPPDERVAIIHLKGSSEYADWLEKVHRKTHLPKTIIVRLALEDWAAKNGHEKPPEL